MRIVRVDCSISFPTESRNDWTFHQGTWAHQVVWKSKCYWQWFSNHSVKTRNKGILWRYSKFSQKFHWKGPFPLVFHQKKCFYSVVDLEEGPRKPAPPPVSLILGKKKKKLQKEEKQQGEQNKTWTPPPAYGVDPPLLLYKWKASQIITAHLNRNTDWNNHNRKGLCLFNIIFSFIVLHSMGSNQKVVYMQMQMV